MARKPASTGTLAPKRQKGYSAVIKAFIPFGDGTAAQIAVLQVIQEIEAGDLSGLAKLAGVKFEVVSKLTSRTVEAT